MADHNAQEVSSPAVDSAALVERWMQVQLSLERQYFQRLGQQSGRQLRLLSLLELDILTLLPEHGQPISDVATALDVPLPLANAVVDRLVRRRLVRRTRGPKGVWLVHRTGKANGVIELILRTQDSLLGNVLGRMDSELRDGVLQLMKEGTLPLGTARRLGKSDKAPPPQDPD